MRKIHFQQIYIKSFISLFAGGYITASLAADIASVTTGKNSNGSYEIQIGGNDLQNIRSYSLNNPARIIIDIPNASSNLSKRITEVTHPVVSNVAVIEGEDRVRATINLSRMLPYEISEKNNKITVILKNDDINSIASIQASKVNHKSATIDFKRGNDGQGKVQIKLPNQQSTIDVIKQGQKVVAKLQGAKFVNTKRLNVSDFGTPVKNIDVHHNNVRISTFDNKYEIVSYQNDDIFSIEFNKTAKQEIDQAQLLPGDNRKRYVGDPLSLNFQDIEVRSVLQLIGDFTNTNIVVSGAVNGSITLRLNNVPWDQALDIILQTKGLSKQENGDVLYIAPSKDIADSKRAAYDVANVEKELAPLQQQLIQIQYARAEEIEKIIEDNSNSNNKEDKDIVDGLLSARGRVSTDPRTNTLIVNDVPSSIEKVRRLVAKLDVSVDQVLIDARIVTAYNTFAHELGVRWGGAFTGATNDIAFGGAGKLKGASGITSSANRNIAKTGQAFPTTTPGLADRLGVNLAASNPTGSFGLSILGSDFLIDMELSAMENEGRGEVISSPRVIAQDGGEAEIRQGTQIPYLKLDDKGNTTTEFKDVPLKLVVRPKVAPNNQVDMELEIIKDRIGEKTRDGAAINSSSVKTQVLVDNGETVVLGGVYEQTTEKGVSKVPVLGDLPIVGKAFRNDSSSVRKNELLIFVTPKIIDKRYTSRDKFIEIRN